MRFPERSEANIRWLRLDFPGEWSVVRMDGDAREAHSSRIRRRLEIPPLCRNLPPERPAAEGASGCLGRGIPPRAGQGAVARRFLSLVFSDRDAAHLIALLRRAPTGFFEAKDLLRAAQCELLQKDSPHVASDLKKIGKGKKLSPVLLVRGHARVGVPLIIADGHHRICASWYWQEDEPVACCIATVPNRPGNRPSRSRSADNVRFGQKRSFSNVCFAQIADMSGSHIYLAEDMAEAVICL
jgi:hypothetical protein